METPFGKKRLAKRNDKDGDDKDDDDKDGDDKAYLKTKC